MSFRASACFFRRVAAAIATPPIWYRGGGFSPAPPSISWALVCMIWFNSESQDHPERENKIRKAGEALISFLHFVFCFSAPNPARRASYYLAR
nr:MAG TPA: hypothetical protein [Caudoviricetes sp.]